MSISYTDFFAEARGALGYGAEADRAALARLRRLRPRADAPDRIEAAPLAEVWPARRLLLLLGLLTDDAGVEAGLPLERAAAALGALAELRAPGPKHPAVALRGVMTEDRFVRLLRMETPAERLAAGRRLVRMLDEGCDPGRLGADLYAWGPRTRVRWAFYFHGASVPDAVTSDETTGDAA